MLNTIIFLGLFLFFYFITNVAASYILILNIFNNTEVLGSVAIELSFLFSVFSYLIFIKKMRSGFSKELFLSKNGISTKNLLMGIAIFLTIILFELFISSLSVVTNSNITGNSTVVYQNAPAPPPVWFYIFVSVIAPIIEEITFRGLFVKRIGIIPSAVIFALLHSGYAGSINSLSFLTLLSAALIFGIISGYALKKTKSLYPSIVAHILVNTIASIPFL